MMQAIFMNTLKIPSVGSKPTTTHPFGLHLVELRQAAKMTQQELANAIGTSQRTVSQWELEGNLPGREVLPKLAQALGLTPGEILQFEPLRQKPGPKGELDHVFEEARQLPKTSQRHLARLVRAWIKEEQR
jgi:transcriptional regulator with XRE-family HTH domain